MRIAAIVVIVLSAAALRAAAQPPPVTPSGDRVTLRGVVVETASGAGLPRARVNLTARAQSVGSALTDGDGGFSVSVAPGATVMVRIVKAGYAAVMVNVTPEQLRAPDPLRIEVPRAAVISGRVVSDTSGSGPFQLAHMVVARRQTAGRAAGVDDVVTVTPDDRGEYRISGLAPGRYVVDAYGPGKDGALSFPNVMKGIAEPQTTPITVDLGPGAEAAGVDFVLERQWLGPPLAAPRADARSTVSGTVTTTAGEPVIDAFVMSSPPGRQPGGARTDAAGRFTLLGVPPGSLTVRASKRGYASSEHGQRGTDLPGLPVTIEAGKNVDNLSIVLPRSGVISGMVIDEHGEPLQEAAVELLRVRRQPSGVLVGIRGQGGPVLRTDDRGHFRLSDLVPGDYIVMASLPTETFAPAVMLRTAYVPVYYPDTPDFASALPIRIADGEEIPGMILTMRRVQVVRVSGEARNSQGLPLTGSIRLTPRHVGAIAPEARVVQPAPTGEFVFADVPPGDWVLRTVAATGPSGPEFAAASVTVADVDPAPLAIRTSPGSTVSGKLVLEGGAGALLWGYSVSTASADLSSSPGSVSKLGSPVQTGEPFTIAGLAGPTRLRVWTDDEHWYLKSILINGFEVADTAFDFGFDGQAYTDVDVVFSHSVASITGRATDDRAAPVRDYAVYVFSTDRDKWVAGSRWVKLARAAADGGFRVPTLPPGDYWAIALDRLDASFGAADWIDTDLLSMLSSRATRVTLGEGQSRDLTLRLIRR